MADINTNQTAQLLTYVRGTSKISAKLATAFLDIPEEKAWIHLQRLVSAGYLEVRLEAHCSDPNCLGVTDVSTFFKDSAGMPTDFECHGCGLFHTVDLDDTNIIFLYQGNVLRDTTGPKILINEKKMGSYKQEQTQMIKAIFTIAGIIGFGLLCTILVGILIVIVLVI